MHESWVNQHQPTHAGKTKICHRAVRETAVSQHRGEAQLRHSLKPLTSRHYGIKVQEVPTSD